MGIRVTTSDKPHSDSEYKPPNKISKLDQNKLVLCLDDVTVLYALLTLSQMQ